MTVKTNLRGRLRNTSLPQASGLLPLFEAIVNSIHAIEETGINSDDGIIEVEINRRPEQLELNKDDDTKGTGRTTEEDILGFTINDNGSGFNEANRESFHTLDSEHKSDKGCRGVGRLLWLKAFDTVEIASIYEEGESKFQRRFRFSPQGIEDEEKKQVEPTAKRHTKVILEGFKKQYRDSSRKTSRAIAESIFEHCLWYFIRAGGCPHIRLRDNGEFIELDDVFEAHVKTKSSLETVSINGYIFNLNHIKVRSSASNQHSVAYCAGSRLVKEEKLGGKVSGLFGKLCDDEGEFVYNCYVNSDFLDERVRQERTGFDIEETTGELYEGIEVSMQDIRNAVVESASAYLGEYLTQNKALSKERVNRFVTYQAPRYRPILKRIPDSELIVDPSISDKDLDLALHKHLSQIERELLEQGHDIMNPHEGEDEANYNKRLRDYLDKAKDLKASDLADYVAHRKVILDLFEKAISQKENGAYVREDLIHNLIMPMRKDSDEIMPGDSNLWLFDERLAFHDYLASDKPLSAIPITKSKSRKEPDLVALNINENPFLASDTAAAPFTSLTVIEIKRPMRNDAKPGEDHDPIEQCLGYLDRIRDGKVQTKNGRPIPKAEDIPAFCYVLCDLTETIRKRCKTLSMTETHDGMGYFHYNPNYKAYIEVISFDRLVHAAKERNRAFFDKLGLPS